MVLLQRPHRLNRTAAHFQLVCEAELGSGTEDTLRFRSVAAASVVDDWPQHLAAQNALRNLEAFSHFSLQKRLSLLVQVWQ